MSGLSEHTWELLPDYMRQDGPLLAFVTAAGDQLDDCMSFLNRADPDTSPSGTCQLTDPAQADRDWLGWLGLMSGMDVNPLPDDAIRGAIADQTLRRRGTQSTMLTRIQRTLTGSRGAVITVASAFEMAVGTRTAQTPDSAVTLAAAMLDKPAGVALTLTVTDGPTYAEQATAYTTYDGVPPGTTYQEMAED